MGTQVRNGTSINTVQFQQMDPNISDAQQFSVKHVMFDTMPVGKGAEAQELDNSINWVEDAAFSQTAVAGVIASAGATSFTVATGTAARFTVNDYIKINDEFLRITGIVDSTHTLTVARGFMGSTAAAATAGRTVYRIASAATEGQTAASGVATTQATKTNYTQIFTTPFEITGSAAAYAGPQGNAYDYKLKRKLIAHKRDIDVATKQNILGVSRSTTAIAGTMTGLDGFLTTYAYAITSTTIGGTSTSTQFTLTKQDTFLNLLSAAGGSRWMCYAGVTAFSSIQAAFKANTQNALAIAGDMNAVFGTTWTTYYTHNGVVSYGKDINAATGTAYYLEASGEDMGPAYHFVNGREMFVNNLGVTGDKRSYQIISELSLSYKQEQTSGIITGIISGG